MKTMLIHQKQKRRKIIKENEKIKSTIRLNRDDDDDLYRLIYKLHDEEDVRTSKNEMINIALRHFLDQEFSVQKQILYESRLGD